MTTKEPPEENEPAPVEDDRKDAPGWFLRRLILQRNELGESFVNIARQSGMTKAQIHQIASEAKSAGVGALIRLAPVFNLSPGQLLDKSLAWWGERGRQEALEASQAKTRGIQERVAQAMRRQPSGPRPAVKFEKPGAKKPIKR